MLLIYLFCDLFFLCFDEFILIDIWKIKNKRSVLSISWIESQAHSNPVLAPETMHGTPFQN